ncbi:MFS transporter [Saccharospirillum impatiens]|uniref:MFS transporter n=1 Tax=Saccharospirillum impatiens TaxID=169438 RepID=UPI0004265974|nr:MFS transporter [Saccharospirillum impatiens]
MQSKTIESGIRANWQQISLQLVQIFLVGLTIGMTRVVIPGLAETEFGLNAQSFFLLTSFVVVFGAVKAVMNLFAGKWSEHFGRKRVLIAGWVVALPIPFLLYWSPNWSWIIVATVLLGFNQGLAWSMALNSKLDLAKTSQKGLINGINEFSGYAAVGIAGVATAVVVEALGARLGLLVFSLTVILAGLLLAMFTVVETLPWAKLHQDPNQPPSDEPEQSLAQLFKFASLQSKPLVALNQAGLVEKFTDALIWIFLPVFFLQQGLTLVQAGSIIAIYGLTWGGLQLITGPLSDRIGRKGLIVWGMVFSGVAVLAIPFTSTVLLWSVEAALAGIGMAMLYPNLGAAVGDFSPPQYRASLVGIYRFWRDSGYAFGALLMGILAQWSQSMTIPFVFVAVSMLLSAALLVWWVPSRRQPGKSAQGTE